ncbi:hypothetical protein RUM44_012818 [Polyplax serrata]|uniref:Nudix hydrolase domain-containing protein n=1 Tax=Polyplax serrata TaxID=468196 RepID=A0ABR1BCD9_POLSC
MDAVEGNIRQLLNGSSLEEEVLCDFTLADQNEAIGNNGILLTPWAGFPQATDVAKGVAPLAASDYVPILSKTVTYIVVGVLINSKNEVLMMQEAKKSCAGQWYLPAGRMEPNETIEDAVKREVLEETGLEMKPTTLLLVESAGGSWFRFIFTGEVVGGSLKTPAQADSESLQAKWVDNVSELSLRAHDVIDIIEKARMYHRLHKAEPWHDRIRPSLKYHDKLFLRLVICIKQKASNRIHVLLSEKTKVHLPVCEIYPARSLHATLRKFMIEIFGADLQLDSHKPHGLLNVEHSVQEGQKHDGLLLTVLVSFRVPLEEVYPIDKYTWVVVSKEIEEALNLRIPKNMTIPLRVVR